MGNLAELTFKTSYHKGRDDIAEAFYMPCMNRAIAYDRAVGFFRSTAFIVAWPALRDFVGRNGRIRVLCSQVLAPADIDALEQGYSARVDEVLASRLLEEVKSLLRDENLAQPARVLAALADFDEAIDNLINAQKPTTAAPHRDSKGRSLLPHQAAGLASWAANGRCGILAFATGSGKTFTAITAIRETLQHRLEPIVVVVPDQVLFGQWHKELLETTRDIAPLVLKAGAGNDGWRETLSMWTAPGERARIVLATVQTAAMVDFRERLSGGAHLMLVADEVHRLGSTWNRNLLDENLFGARLGLSATPERAGDPVGTSALLNYFRGILEPRYTLADAVRDGVLCRYFYRPHTVALSDTEIAEWRALSAEIARLRGRMVRGDASPGIEERLKRTLIRRARIIKHAAAKIPLSVAVLLQEYKPGQRWIVYCEDRAQLDVVSGSLLAAGIQNMPFHSEMDGDQSQTLKWLDVRGGVVVAIKCLDEGVDVPSVSHALILASSKNPREFIQRRGRVLRKSPNKALAYVHDAIVVPPPPGEDQDQGPDPITAGELARAVNFAQHADNPACAADLQQIAIGAGIEWRSLIDIGSEDAED